MLALAVAAMIACPAPIAKDGDDIVCDGQDLRIEGINARELDGECRNGSPCTAMDGHRAKTTLQRLVAGGLTYTVSYRDRYGRSVVAAVLPDGTDLACALIAAGSAARWDRYWPTGKRCA